MDEKELLVKLMRRKITEILRVSFKNEFIRWHFYSAEEEELFYKGQPARLYIRDYSGFCVVKYYISADELEVHFELSRREGY